MKKVSDNPFFDSRFARTLRDQLISRHDITVSSLARKMNTDRRTICAWRDGERLPRLDQAARLAEILKIDVHILV